MCPLRTLFSDIFSTKGLCKNNFPIPDFFSPVSD
jgi:hypothetical protein